MKSKDSKTLSYLKKRKSSFVRKPIPTTLKGNKNLLELEGATGHNLQNCHLKLPLNRLVTVTGVSGSGKSSLISQTLYPALARYFELEFAIGLPFKKLKGHKDLQNILYIDQSAVGRTSRSTPASFIKIFDPIRVIFSKTKEAQSRGYRPGTFSLNVDGGRCPTCKGLGYEEIDMVFMDNIFVTCEDCNGLKFTKALLEIKYKDKNINDVLNMTVQEASLFFTEFSSIRKPLSLLKEVGLDYLKIGQSSQSLSGGESQRLKIARELSQNLKKDTLFILDEPSTGLHFQEIHLLIKVLNKLVESGSSVVVIEHNLEIIAHSDFIIDIGPEAGGSGGVIVAQAPPSEFVKSKGVTASYLKKYLKDYF